MHFNLCAPIIFAESFCIEVKNACGIRAGFVIRLLKCLNGTNDALERNDGIEWKIFQIERIGAYEMTWNLFLTRKGLRVECY